MHILYYLTKVSPKKKEQNQTTYQNSNPGDPTADTLSAMSSNAVYAICKQRTRVTQLHSTDQEQVCYRHFHKTSTV